MTAFVQFIPSRVASIMIAFVVAVVVVAASAGCERSSSPGDGPGAAPEPVATATRAGPAYEEPSERMRAPVSAIGVAADAAHVAPEYELARYDHARSVARSGDLARAARELEALLAQDLTQFAPKLEADADLATLRRSPEGAWLRERRRALEQDYDHALHCGVPVMRGGEVRDGDAPLPVSRWVQAGVYDHASRRFVPAAAPVRATRGAMPLMPLASSFFDTISGQVLSIAAIGRNADVAAIDGAHLSVHGAPSGHSLGDLTPAAPEGFGSIELVATVDGARWRAIDMAGDMTAFTPWRSIGGSSTQTVGPVLRVEQEGAYLVPAAPRGFALRGRVLRTPRGNVRLGDGHTAEGMQHSIVATDDSAIAIVVSVQSPSPGCGGDYDLQHTVERVDTRAGTSEQLARGPGWAFATLAPDGTLYVQTGESVRRYAQPTAAQYEPIPSGILLVAFPPNCD